MKGYVSGCADTDSKFCSAELSAQIMVSRVHRYYSDDGDVCVDCVVSFQVLFLTDLFVGQIVEVALPVLKAKCQRCCNDRDEEQHRAKLAHKEGLTSDAKIQEESAVLSADTPTERIAIVERRRSAHRDPDSEFVTEEQENEAELSNYWVDGGGVSADYAEKMIEFGFVALFSVSFMLAPALAVLNNLIEQRTDAYKIDRAMQRPECRRDAGIGVYFAVLYFLVCIGVMTNILLIIKYDAASDDSWYNTSSTLTVVFVVVG